MGEMDLIADCCSLLLAGSMGVSTLVTKEIEAQQVVPELFPWGCRGPLAGRQVWCALG